MWPVEARPARLQDRKVVARWSIGKLMEFKRQYEMEAEKQGVGTAVFGRDKKRRTKLYKAMKDNGEDKLHPARFERLPFADPDKYWEQVPVKREEIYRHLKLDLYGAQGQVNEATVVRLHDRRVTVDLDMFTRGSLNKELKGVDKSAEVVDTKHLQEVVANYASVMQILWPMDYSPSVISRVLIDARWGEVIEEDKLRTAVVKRFFSEVIRENCGRAVRREPPMVYSEAREKWLQVLKALCCKQTGSASCLTTPEWVAPPALWRGGSQPPRNRIRRDPAVASGGRTGQRPAGMECLFATDTIHTQGARERRVGPAYARTRRETLMHMCVTGGTMQVISTACRAMPGWLGISSRKKGRGPGQRSRAAQ
jgi:hypothetical protein